MKWYWRVAIIVFSSALLLTILGFGGCLLSWQYSTGGCEQSWHVVTFENHTPYTVKTLVMNWIPGSDQRSLSPTWGYNDMPLQIPIEPGESWKGRILVRARRNNHEQYSVFALTEHQGIVFLEVYTWDDLDDMRWRVVITVNYEDPHTGARS